MITSDNLNTAAFTEAKNFLVGGVNSPVRAFSSVGGIPRFIERAKGAYVYDIEGKQYTDYIASWGPMILGHAPEVVRQALQEAIVKGSSFGAPTLAETELAKLIVSILPGVQKIRMLNSGTEALMTALRLARGVTGRDKIVKFEGCYHGHSDSFLLKAGSGPLTLGMASSKGVPKDVIKHTLVASYNNRASVEAIFGEHSSSIAAIVLEPICGNMGVIAAENAFLDCVFDCAKKAGALVIFDEVMTGFRVALGGAAQLFKRKPDIYCLGKIIGGGLPAAAIGASSSLMQALAPEGPVYQAGTLSGNPLAVAAGLATLKFLQQNAQQVYQKLERIGARVESSLLASLKKHAIPAVVNRVGSMFTVFFTNLPSVNTYNDVRSIDTKRYARFFHAMLKRGHALPPSAYEACFLSLAHSDEDIKRSMLAFDESLAEIS